MGNKKLLKDSEVTLPQVTRFKELNAKVALSFVPSSAELKKYIPDSWSNAKKICRQYLWMVIATKKFDFYHQVVEAAHMRRMKEVN